MNAFKYDYLRYTPAPYHAITVFLRWVKSYELKFLYFLRKYQSTGSKIYKIILNHFRKKYGLEIMNKNIGTGLRLIHAYGITVNSLAEIGNRATLFKGVTIGQIDNGPKAGNPKIGDYFTAYANATVCGNIVIGDHVTVAAGAFVNFDVPSHATVIGNPGVIHLCSKSEKNGGT